MGDCLIFADESGTDSSHKCYSITALKFTHLQIEMFNKYFLEEITKKNVIGELKWKKIRNSYGTIDFCVDAFRYLLENQVNVGIIVVKKDVFRKWQENKETAFYMTYDFLLQHLLKSDELEFEVFIDNRQDSYEKQSEVLQKITNSMLKKIGSRAKINGVNKSDSRLLHAIQMCDIICGAVNASHNFALDPKYSINEGKRALIRRISEILGWDDLRYDTYPNDKFNIWQFPIEYREYSAKKMFVGII